MSLIRIRKLTKSYHTAAGEVRALDGLSLDINRGEFVAIVGQSGSGKSTLMNILGCLDTPTGGTYELEGRNTAHCSAAALADIRGRRIGFVFQGFHLIPSLSALENVELPLIYRHIGREERRRRAVESLQRVGLADRLHHRPAELSGGQQQRVAIARAIAMAPPLILADEPTGNLDSHSGEEVMALLHRLNREGRTVVLITHDNAIAASLPRRIRIGDGKVIG